MDSSTEPLSTAVDTRLQEDHLTPLFKKRKKNASTLRKPSPREAPPEDDEAIGPSLTEILRQTEAKKKSRFKGGVSAGTAQEREAKLRSQAEAAMVKLEDAPKHDLYRGRFVPASGSNVAAYDDQEREYVDRMAELRYGQSLSTPSESSLEPTSRTNTNDRLSPYASQPSGHAATMGKLEEVDLGPEAKRQAEERLKAALAKMNGDDTSIEEPPGKRKRPNRWETEETIQRRRDIDKLVNKFNRENPLNYFARPEAEQKETDESLYQRFLQAEAEQNEVRNQPKKPQASVKPGEEKLKGPKLGGSRNARAAALAKGQEQGKR